MGPDYGLEILLYIEFQGGNRTMYRCVDTDSADQCTMTNPSNPSSAPGCTQVAKAK